MPVDVAAWVKELELPEDQQKIVLEAIGKGGEKTLKVLEGRAERQSDYSRRMGELQQEQAKLKADFDKKVADEEKKSTDYAKTLGTWKTEKEKVLNESIKAREDAEAKLTAVQAKIKELGSSYSIPDTELATILTPAVPDKDKRNEPPPRDFDGKFVSKEDYEKALREMPLIPAIITSLEREHLRLFGPEAEMPDWVEMVRAGKPLRAQWEEKYKVKERRDAIAKETHDKEIAAAKKAGAEEERSKILAEHPDMGTTVRRESEAGSPVLAAIKKQNDKRDGDKDPRRGIAAAVNAFNEHKYVEKSA